MKTRTKEKRIKDAWRLIANKLPAVLPTKRDRKEWVSKNSRQARKERKINRMLDRHEKKEWFVPWEEWKPPPFHTESYVTRTFINQDG